MPSSSDQSQASRSAQAAKRLVMIGDPFVAVVLLHGAAAEPVRNREGDAGQVHAFVGDVFRRVVAALPAT
uniref:Uncharacterized protein n=1 Tax=Pseudomonas phage PACT201 TaxID=3230130 RepID=A0AAU8GTM4_9VIRU